MTDRTIRIGVLVAATLAVLAVLFDAPSIVRVPLVLGFALVAPGLALSRFVPTLSGLDRVGLVVGISMALNVTASLLLVALGRWRGTPVLGLLAAVSIVMAVMPLQAPWVRSREGSERLRHEQIRDRRIAQRQAYAQVQSKVAAERSAGLVALSWLLEDDDRREDAVRLRALARQDSPPRLRLDDQVATQDEVKLVHEHARSEDPEVRRQGLFEIAELLHDGGLGDQADTLRAVADDTV